MGLMFKDTLTWSPATGCDHWCPYCSAYIDTFPRVSTTPKYFQRGWTPTVHWDLVRKGPPKTKRPNIFVSYMGDLFCGSFRSQDIYEVLLSCKESKYFGNFLLLTKNSPRYLEILSRWPMFANDHRFIWGTSIETNDDENGHLSPHAPKPSCRYDAMKDLIRQFPTIRTFLCLEPIMDFDIKELGYWIGSIKPEFAYIGYDNHGHIPGRLEPPRSKVEQLMKEHPEVQWRLKTIREARR